MKHDWRKDVALCIYCHTWCPNCNDCICPAKGWTNYSASRCPGFDTEAGLLRPYKGGHLQECGVNMNPPLHCTCLDYTPEHTI